VSEHAELAAYLTGLAANGDFHHDRVLLTRAAELLLAADPVEASAPVEAPAPAAEPAPEEPEAEGEAAADYVEAPVDGD